MPVDEFIESVIINRLLEDDARDLFASPDTNGVNREALRIERVAIEDRLDGIAEMMAEGMPRDKAREQLSRLRGRLNEIDGVLAPAPVNFGLQVVDAVDVRGAWASLDIQRRRLIMAELMTVTLLPSNRGAKGFDSELVQY